MRQVISGPFKRWILPRYTKEINNESVYLSTESTVPFIRKAKQVLIKVKASTVNPIDIEISRGFGDNGLRVLRLARKLTVDCYEEITYDKFPIVLGRDFSGVIIAKGSDVKEFNIGQEVIGFIPPEITNGSHASHVLSDSCHITLKPENLTHEEASCIPYAGLTAYSAIHCSAGLNAETSFNRKVLLLGATGGVGIIAAQLLTSYGALVTATASNDAVDWLKSQVPLLDSIIDYTSDPNLSGLNNYFDVVINAASMSSAPQLQVAALRTLKKDGTYVTLTSPLLSNLDQYGYLGGGLKSITEVAKDTVTMFRDGRKKLRWAFFYPSANGLAYMAQQSSIGRIQPVISETVQFDHVVDLYKKSYAGHARGKRVLQVD